MSNFHSTKVFSLAELGWNKRFQQQLTLDEWQTYMPARVVAQHKTELQLLTQQGPLTIKAPIDSTVHDTRLTVGDWLLLDSQHNLYRRLSRSSVFRRKAAGGKLEQQLIAANVDTVLIVSSLNDDFNLNRLERYLVLAHEAGAEPVVVLTKADLCTTQQKQQCIAQLHSLNNLLMVVALNALDAEVKQQLAPWCKIGQTLALLGSSGVGKSTLVNTLLGENSQQTQTIREDDSKGHHTTTGRSLHILPGQTGIVLDTPGMRELQLANSEQGIAETFRDILQLANQCKFSDCKHDNEPGCAVQLAIEQGELTSRRLSSYLKLQREDVINSATLAQRRSQDRKREKFYRSVQSDMKRLKNR